MNNSKFSTDAAAAFEVLNAQILALGSAESVHFFFDHLQGLISKLDRLNPNHLKSVLEKFSPPKEGELYNEVGSLLRRFHTRMTEIGDLIPEGITQLDEDEVSGMTGHLQHILKITDKAANRTLDLSEETLDALSEEGSELSALQVELGQLAGYSCLDEQAKKKIESVTAGVQRMLAQNTAHQNRVNNILLAQDFQDLTGQLIQKMLGLVGILENDLVSLVRQFGTVKAQKEKDPLLNGPLAAENEQRQDQNDIDSLLGQFGF